MCLAACSSGSDSEEEEADPSDVEESEEEEAEVSASVEMKTKRKRVFTLGAAEQMKKQKVSMEDSAPPSPKQSNIGDVEMEHLRGFEGEGRVASLWDRRFNFDCHVRNHLFFCTDQDKLRRAGHADVAGFVKSSALRIAVGAEFLLEELNMSRTEVSRLASELDKAKVGREKAERELTRARKESEYTEGCLVREWKRSVTESFQNAIDQVRLGFPHLNLDSIALDPFKVVEGEKLVDPPSARR